MSLALAARGETFAIVDATGDARRVEAYRRLRRQAFVEEQGLFDGHDLDEFDAADATRVLVAVDADGDVVGGVRLHPEPDHPHLAWWRGSRLVCSKHPGVRRGDVGGALVRAACATAQAEGALRFDAHVQERFGAFFERLGWEHAGAVQVAGTPHLLMRWPIGRFEPARAGDEGAARGPARGPAACRPLAGRRRRPRRRHRRRRVHRRDPPLDGRRRPRVGRLVRHARQRARPRRDGRDSCRRARRPRRP